MLHCPSRVSGTKPYSLVSDLTKCSLFPPAKSINNYPPMIEQGVRKGMSRLLKLLLLAAIAITLTAGRVPMVSAHAHFVITPNHTQVIANGQLHAPFVSDVSCGGNPAAYGLETAHHGPDSGTPGKADGCYQRDGPTDNVNPAIGQTVGNKP